METQDSSTLQQDIKLLTALVQRAMASLRRPRFQAISGTATMQPFKLATHDYAHDFVFNPSAAAVNITILTGAGVTTLAVNSGQWVALGFDPGAEMTSVSPDATLLYKESMDEQP